MAPHKTISYVSTLLLLITLAFTSCSKDSDLFDATVESQIEEEKDKQLDENGQLIPSVSFEAMDDEFTISGNVGSSTLDVLKNDNVQDTESFQIVEVSEPTEGTLTINADNTLTYTPHPDAANKAGDNGVVSDNFTYTLQASKGGNTGNKTASVVVNTQYGNMDMGALKAFPGAEGYGKNTVGGRGGKVIHVTNLKEDGPGSLVEAMHATGPRIVVFDVGGEITWTSEHIIRNPNITIAGETAPSPGITIKGHTLGIRASEVIVRFLRIRVADDVNGNIDGIRIINDRSNTVMQNIIVDHCDVSLGTDELISLDGNSIGATNAPLQNVTIQNCFISDGIGNNNYAMFIGENLTNISIIRNGFFNNGNRVPEHADPESSNGIEFVNNIIYNYNRPVTLGFGDIEFDSVGNVFKGDKDYPPSQTDHRYQFNGYVNPNGVVTDGRIHQSDNIQIGYSNYGMMNNDWASVNQPDRVAASDYTPLPSSQVVDALLYDLGASVIFPDIIAETLINEFINSSGTREHTSTASAGGVPTIESIVRPQAYDSDHDGMNDEWEIRTFGTLNKDSSSDENGNGYTNIEEFFHSLLIF